MKLTFRLTLEGLIRALRAQAHRLADDVETQLPDEPGEVAAEIMRIREAGRRMAHVGGD